MLPRLVLDCEKQLGPLRAALRASDPDTLRRGAHTIRSSAAVFSAHRIVDAARVIEEASGDQDVDLIEGHIEVLAAEIERVKALSFE